VVEDRPRVARALVKARLEALAAAIVRVLDRLAVVKVRVEQDWIKPERESVLWRKNECS
jgi:hypothetical protein